MVLSPELVKLGLAELEFRDRLLACLEGALGIRQGELGALRWLECDFENMSFSLQHSYYLASRWEPEEHKNGSVCKTVANASCVFGKAAEPWYASEQRFRIQGR